jgi:Holliday junction resolvase RusA-like endonuclease
MMQPISFWVPGVPKGQPRVKAFARKMGAKFVARVFTPGTAEEWKGQIAIISKTLLPAEPLALALHLRLTFYFPRPKKHFGTGSKATQQRVDAPHYHTGTPDADNAAKAVMDALTVLGMWKDDGQVAKLSVTKFYSADPGCLIEISEPTDQ